MTASTGARRLRQPSWKDPRLLIGVLLVLASVAVGARVLSVADRTSPVFLARVTLPAGSTLRAGQLTVARLRLTGGSAAYLDASRPVPAGLVLQRTVGAGELVPAAAVTQAAVLSARPVSVPLDAGAAAGIVAGGRVDLWLVGSDQGSDQSSDQSSAQERAEGSDEASGAGGSGARRIAAGVEVYQVVTAGQGGLAAGRAATVQVLVPQVQLPAVLAALAGDQDEQRVTLLPVPGSSG